MNKFEDIEAIGFQKIKGVVVIDELGVNASSRRSMSDWNARINSLWMLWRKKNVDIIGIAQLEFTIDKILRSLSQYNIVMSAFFENQKLMFNSRIYKSWIKAQEIMLSEKTLDLIQFSNKTKITYNTLDTALIT